MEEAAGPGAGCSELQETFLGQLAGSANSTLGAGEVRVTRCLC